MSLIEQLLEADDAQGAELVWEEGNKQIYKINTVGGGLALGWRNTKWCVKDTKYFDQYGPPFYCLLVSGKPHVLLHFGSDQIVDECDDETNDWGDFVRAKIIDIKNPKWAFRYAHDIIGGRWSTGEFSIMKDPKYSYHYAMEVIKGRWPEAEPYIMKDPERAIKYAQWFIGRWPELELFILKLENPKWAFHYARDVIGRWPEAERIIMKNPQWAFAYASVVIEGRWPEAEPYIMKNPKWAQYYIDEILGDSAS